MGDSSELRVENLPRCISCNYIKLGSSTDRCPECGTVWPDELIRLIPRNALRPMSGAQLVLRLVWPWLWGSGLFFMSHLGQNFALIYLLLTILPLLVWSLSNLLRIVDRLTFLSLRRHPSHIVADRFRRRRTVVLAFVASSQMLGAFGLIGRSFMPVLMQ